ncbi:MAG: tetratricopeptide repeat protein [Candidatus Saliniplasma sp.]
MSENRKECDVCGTLNSPEAIECKNCGNEIGNHDEEYAVLNALKQISGVGSSRAKNIVEAGYSEMDELDDIGIENIASIEGIGESIASDIVETIEETKEEGGLYLCDECGAFVGKDADRCSNCGAVMEEVEEEEEGVDSSDIKEDTPEEKEEDSLFLCSNCGSFIGSGTSVCQHCGARMEDVEEGTEDEKPEGMDKPKPEEMDSEDMDEEEEGLFLCTNCGAFVSVSSTECPHCGYTLDEVEKDEVEQEVGEDIGPEESETIEKEPDELEPEVSLEDEIEDGVKVSEYTDDVNEDIEKELEREMQTVEEELEMEDENEDISEDGVEKENGWEVQDESSLYSEDPDVVGLEESLEEDIEETFTSDEEQLEDELEVEEITSSTVDAVPVGDDVKICGNCGWISDGSVDECPMCEYEFSEEPVESELESPKKIETSDESIDEDVKTIRRAFGISEESDGIEKKEEDDLLDRENDVEICTVCGAFLTKDSDRCSVCGSLTSETPELDTLEEEPHIDYTEDQISICDACGAFVREDKERCSICGSDMELARKDIDEEEVQTPKDQDETLGRFFGENISAEDKGIPEDDEEVEIYLCNRCGAIVSSDAEVCSICHSDLSESGVETEEEYVSRDVSKTEEEFELERPELEEAGESKIGDESPPTIHEEASTEIEKESSEFDVELNQEIETLLTDIYQEQTEKEGVGERTDSKFEGEYEESDLEEALEELDRDVLSADKEDKEGSEKDEWMECPICNSHVSVDSDYCTVCENPLGEGEKGYDKDKEIIKVTESGPTVAATPKEVESDSTMASDSHPAFKGVKKQSQKNDFVESHIESSLKNVLYKAKDYEVPISSLSLLAFGGVYLTTYRTSNFTYFAEIGLVLIALFFGLGILTVFVFKDEMLSYSLLGFMGYITGIFISSLVPISRYILGLNLPILASAGMIASALGLFWILENRLPKKFHYYMLWFSGISVLFVALLTMMVYPVQLSLFEYPIILPLGFGSTMVVGGTAIWYKETDKTYEAAPSRSPGWKISSYNNTKGYFEDTNKTCPVSNEEAIPHYSKGIASCSIGEYDDAIKKFKKALELEGDNEAIWNNLGTAYSRLGDQDKARECLRQALDQDETYAIAWNNLGNANFRCGNYSDALDCYDKALKIEENYRDAKLNKSQVLIKLSKVEES